MPTLKDSYALRHADILHSTQFAT